MQTFSCACQTINIDEHIIARFEAGSLENPDDTSVCRLTVWHEGGEATITTFCRNGFVTGSVMIPPPEQAAKASKASADDTSSSKGSKK